MKEKIKEQLISATDEIFLEWQAKLNVVSGDIEPLLSLGFDKAIEDLTEIMVSILQRQPKLGIAKFEMLDGSIINLAHINLGYEEIQKLAEVERYLREKEVIG